MRLPDPQRSCAVLIGTSAYRSAELADRPAVANNLTALHDVLTDPALGGLQPARCIVVADRTDVQEVYSTLRRLAHEATDTLLVYFAGHGLLDPHRSELCLALAGSHQADLPAGALPIEWIRQLFLNCKATYGVLVLDCCFSGRATTTHLSGAEETVLGQIDIKGTYTLAAAGANQLALAPPGETYTAFTGELLTLVQDGIPEGPELLTYATIYRHLLRTLTARGLPQPHQLNSGTTEQLALAHNPAHSKNTTKPRTHRTQRASGADRSPIATAVTVLPVKNLAIGRHMFAFSSDSDNLAVVTARNTVQVFDTASWRQSRVLRQHWLGGASIYRVACSQDDRLATAVSLVKGGHLIQLWTVHAGRRLNKIAVDATVRALAFSPYGGWLATSDNNGSVHVWDTLSRRTLISVRHNAEVDGVAFSPDGRKLATGGSDRTARIWDVYTGEPLAVLAHDHFVTAVTFSPDGRLLATASTPVLIWDAQTGVQLRTLSPAPATGLGQLCHDLAFSPDGRFLAAAFIDHTARVWDIYNGVEVFNLTHDHEVRAVRFSPDGRWLVTGSGRWAHERPHGPAAVRVWQLKEG